MKTKSIHVAAALEILGCIIGAFNFLSEMAGSWQSVLSRPSTALLFILALSLFCLSVAAGVLLWKGKPLGVPLSVAAQFPQIIQFTAGGFDYLFFAGAAALVGLSNDGGSLHLLLNLNLGGDFGFTWGPDAAPISASVNIYAIAFILELFRQRNANASEVKRTPG